MKTLFVNRNVIISIFTVILLTYSMQGISYGQGKAPTITQGETNTSLVVNFQITLDSGVDENAYQVQLRRENPIGEWITKCVVIKRGKQFSEPYSSQGGTGEPDVFVSSVYFSGGWLTFGSYSTQTFRIRAIFANLDPGTTYEARYRDTNLPACDQNPSDPDPWSEVGEGTTRLVAPPRAEFVDANLARGVRKALELDTEGGHIDLLKIPQASLEELTELRLEDKEITDLIGIEQATQLTKLNLVNNNITDLTPLAQLTQLTTLHLSYNKIIDVTPLAQLTQLTLLDLWDNLIEDLSNLRPLLHENPMLHLSTNIPIATTKPGGRTSIYFINGRDIHLLNNDGTYRQNIVVGLRQPRGISLDIASGKIYWTNAGFFTNEIQRANLDGSNVESIFKEDELDYPKDVAVADGKIYWTNTGFWSGDVKIQRADLDGTNTENIITELGDPGGIAIDSVNSKIYWTTYSKIHRANLDGTNIENIVVTGTSNANGIALNIADGKIYWADGDSNTIKRANLNGTNIQDVITHLDNPDGIALDIESGKIYWTEWKQVYEAPSDSERDDRYTLRIQRANLDGTNIENIVNGLTDLRGIALSFSQSPISTTTDAVVSISPASAVSPAVGEQLEFSLNITSGESVAGYQATVQFDDTALRYVSSANGNFLPAGAFFVQSVVDGNLVKLNAASLAGQSNGDGTLATLTFEIIAVKESALMLSDVLLSDNTGSTSVPNVENAEITESTGIKGDVNGDGTVNIADLVLVASNIGETGQHAADVNDDGVVNIADLVLVAGALGASAGSAPSLHAKDLEILTATDVKQWLSAAEQLKLTDATSQRGVLFLQQLLVALTPKKTALLPNYPNPFNPETWIPYYLVKDADVTLHIYTMNGTLVRTLALEHQAAGVYTDRSRAIHWDGRNELGEKVATGVYFYTLTAGDFSATRKMLIRK